MLICMKKALKFFLKLLLRQSYCAEVLIKVNIIQLFFSGHCVAITFACTFPLPWKVDVFTSILHIYVFSVLVDFWELAFKIFQEQNSSKSQILKSKEKKIKVVSVSQFLLNTKSCSKFNLQGLVYILIVINALLALCWLQNKQTTKKIRPGR